MQGYPPPGKGAVVEAVGGLVLVGCPVGGGAVVVAVGDEVAAAPPELNVQVRGWEAVRPW